MPEVPARKWPATLPMNDIVENVKNDPYVTKEGFVCKAGPGDFKYLDANYKGTDDPNKITWFVFNCPRTGKYCCTIRVGLNTKPIDTKHSWQWDGNLEKPTLHPSINCLDGCTWHGWVTSGVFKD